MAILESALRDWSGLPRSWLEEEVSTSSPQEATLLSGFGYFGSGAFRLPQLGCSCIPIEYAKRRTRFVFVAYFWRKCVRLWAWWGGTFPARLVVGSACTNAEHRRVLKLATATQRRRWLRWSIGRRYRSGKPFLASSG